jgi:hypothetical protein
MAVVKTCASSETIVRMTGDAYVLKEALQICISRRACQARDENCRLFAVTAGQILETSQ